MTMDVEFTFDEAVRTLGITPGRLEKLIDEGKIRASREPSGIRITRSAILDYMRQVSEVPAIDRSKRR